MTVELKETEGLEKIYHNVLMIDKAFRLNAEELRIKAKAPKESIDSILEDLAKRSFMLYHKGLYIIPDMIVPANVQEALIKYHKD